MNSQINSQMKHLIVLAHDALMICAAWLAAYWLRYNLAMIPMNALAAAASSLPIVFVLQLSCFYGFGLYRGIWQFASIPDLMRILKAVATGVVLSLVFITALTGLKDVPRSVFPLYAMILIGLLSTPRYLVRWWKDRLSTGIHGKQVLIVGAGSAGDSLIRSLIRSNPSEYSAVAIVDDDPAKIGLEIHGIRVVGPVDQIPAIVKRYSIDHIFVAIPIATSSQMRRIVEFCEASDVPFSTLPSLSDLVSGRVSIQALRDVSLVDLLGRDQVELKCDESSNGLFGKRILVTGAGGSIGSELIRQLARQHPEQLILVDACEFNLYSIESEMRTQHPEVECCVYLDNVCDKIAMQAILGTHRPQLVFHAAAFKHVPLLQAQARAAIQNNVIGTETIARASAEAGVLRFILISTDKAVNPLGIMGATKRVAELLCQEFNQIYETEFITVRFGNVLGSAGSVIPLFQKQLKEGGPLTVTHPDMTRYFMTIPEASLLILQASLIGQGGEIVVLDMGEPIKISYLAEQMIRLSGKQIGKDVKIVYTGLRPGEKLTEELFFCAETFVKTSHEKIFIAKHCPRSFFLTTSDLKKLHKGVQEYDESLLVNTLKTIVENSKELIDEQHS